MKFDVRLIQYTIPMRALWAYYCQETADENKYLEITILN